MTRSSPALSNVMLTSVVLPWFWWRSLAALAAAHTPANPPPTISMFDIRSTFQKNDGLAVESLVTAPITGGGA
jgi:hypothetical protein